ncbi:MAG: type II toxin-antitoxin system PemK/MazF family toxin [Chloroflexota bacterium]
MRRGEVYWVDFDPARGGEIQKRRPAVIISNDDANRRMNRLQVVPFTSKTSRPFPAEPIVSVSGRPHKALATQLRTVTKEHVGDYVGVLSPRDLGVVEEGILIQLDLL